MVAQDEAVVRLEACALIESVIAWMARVCGP